MLMIDSVEGLTTDQYQSIIYMEKYQDYHQHISNYFFLNMHSYLGSMGYAWK